MAATYTFIMNKKQNGYQNAKKTHIFVIMARDC